MKQPRTVPWGESVLVFDNETFATGYTFGRFLYFYDAHPRDEHGRLLLAASDLVGTLLLLAELSQPLARKTKGTIRESKLARQFGVMVGYLSGAMYPETREEFEGWDAFFARACSIEDEEGRGVRHQLMCLSPWWEGQQAPGAQKYTDKVAMCVEKEATFQDQLRAQEVIVGE